MQQQQNPLTTISSRIGTKIEKEKEINK